MFPYKLLPFMHGGRTVTLPARRMNETGPIDFPGERIERLVCASCGCAMDVSNLEPFVLVECPQCQTEMPVPAPLGEYLLVRALGEGAMGAVYQAHDPTLKRNVAIKLMRRDLGDDDEFIEKFLHEAQALAALNHRNVAQIYRCGKDAGRPYIVMELVYGGRLDEWMKDGGPLDEELMLHVAIDVAQGLKAAGDIGMVHGDVKPQNILFDKDHTAKVVDFGLARFKGDQPRTGEVWGTPFYVAPEVAQGTIPDQQADIYSLGATLYHALAGVPPFNEKTAVKTVLARFDAPAPDLKALRPELNPQLTSLVMRMLEADRFRRFPTYESLLADMDETLRALISSKTPEKKSRKKKKKSSPVPAILSIIVILSLLGVAGGLVWSMIEKKKVADAKKRPKSSGPVTVKFVDGKLVRVQEPSGGADKARKVSKARKKRSKPKPKKKKRRYKGNLPVVPHDISIVHISSADGLGADAYIEGYGGGHDSGDTSFGRAKALWVKAGADTDLHKARKTYMQFDLSPLGGTPIIDAALTLTATSSGKNKSVGDYTLILWGVTEEAERGGWSDRPAGKKALPVKIATWNNAPVNYRQSTHELTSGAERLVEVRVAANPGVGEAITFSNADSISPDKFLEFLRSDTDGVITFVITANTASEQRAGWKFASREHGALDAPTLVLKREQ